MENAEKLLVIFLKLFYSFRECGGVILMQEIYTKASQTYEVGILEE